MIKALLTTLVLLLPGVCFAQNIAIPMDRIGAGSVITIQTSTGQVQTHRILGPAGNNTYAYETYNGSGIRGTPAWVVYTDVRGNLVSRVDSAGRITSWTPHRCNRTPGTCSYTEIRPNGMQQTFVRQTQAVDGGFIYQLNDSTGALILSGRAMLNAMGWTQQGTTQALNAPPVTVQIISAQFR